jgi:HEAT repeats
MARSLWKKTLVASLAWASLALGQQPFAPAPPAAATPAGTPERTLTVQEPGKPAQKCAILKTWKTAEGTTAYQVKVLATGEMMTIVESGPVTTVPGRQPGSRLQAITTRIFHWGQSPSPPAGTPLPPAESVQITPMPVPAPAPAPVIHEEVVTEVEQPKPATRFLPRIFTRNRDEAVTIETRPYSPLPASTYGPADGSVPATTITSVSTPASAPLPGPASAPAPAPAVPAKTPAVLPPVSGSEQGRIDTLKPQAVAVQPPVPAATPAQPPAPPATPAQPTDWRQSWGKADDDHRSRLIPKILPVKEKDEARDANSQSSLPASQNRQPDPLRTPDQYTSDSLEKKYAAGYSNAVQKPPEQPRAAFSSWIAPQKAGSPTSAAQPVAPAPITPAAIRQTTSDAASTVNVPVRQTAVPAPTSQAPTSNQRIPLGAGSIVAASQAAGGSPGYIPVPVIGLPVANPQPIAPPPNIPQPPQVYDLPRPPAIYAGQGYPNGPAYRALGQTPTTSDPGVANAFIGVPTREMVAQASNAFTSGPQMMAAPPQASPMMYSSNPYAQMAQQLPATQTVVPAAQPVVTASYQALQAESGKGQSLSELISVLRDSLYPSQREQAAERMCAYDWRANQQVAAALITAAQDDPAATVRMQCIHCLARMRVNSPAALKAIRSLRSDPDSRVRQEADHAEATLAMYNH